MPSPSSAKDKIPIVYSPLSLLHNPPHEILSGCVQPYFESPERYHRILSALLDDSSRYTAHELEVTRDSVETKELKEAVARVHEEDYLVFLEEIYEEWIKEGGSKVRSSIARSIGLEKH